MFTYYTIYSFLLISTIFEMSNRRTKKVVMLFWCVFFTFFVGLRWQVGTDWDSYFEIFRASTFDSIFSLDKYGDGRENVEPLYVLLNAIVNETFGEFYIFNLLEAGIIQFSLFYVSRYFTPNTPIITYAFLFILIGLFPVRASLSLAVALWGYKYIREQKLIKFLIILAAACMIHMKTAILFPCYWIGKIKLKWYLFFIIYLSIVMLYVTFQQQLTALVSLFDSSSMADKFLVYTKNETEGFRGLSYIGVGLNVFLMSIYLYLRKRKILVDTRWHNAILNMYLISLCLYALFSDGMGDLTRLATIFILPQVLLLVSAISYYGHHRVLILKMGAIFFFVLYYIYRIYQETHAYFFEECNIPYRTIFDFNI